MVLATRTKLSSDGADTSVGLYGERYGDGVRSGERPIHSVAIVFLVLGSLKADSTEPTAASTSKQAELNPKSCDRYNILIIYYLLLLISLITLYVDLIRLYYFLLEARRPFQIQ